MSSQQNKQKKRNVRRETPKQHPSPQDQAPTGPIDTMPIEDSASSDVASSSPAFGSESITQSSFSFVPENDGETNALARLQRKENELKQTKEEYHDLLVQRDARIDDIENTLEVFRTELAALRKEKDTTARELSEFKSAHEDLSKALKEAQEALKLQKGVSEIDRDDAVKLRKEVAEKNKKIQLQYDVTAKFQTRIAEQAASLQGLHQKLDAAEAEKEALRQANSELAVQHDTTTNDITKATQDFEQIFKDIGQDLDLHGYVGHVRDLINNGQLKRQDSSLSLQRQLSPQKSFNQLPPLNGQTLGDQLAAADDGGSERSVPTGEDDDNEKTFQSLGLGKSWTEYDYFCHIQEQEKKITELQNQLAAAQPTGPLSAPPTDQELSFSTITAQDTAPSAGEPPEQARAMVHSTTQTEGLDRPLSAAPTAQQLSFSTIESQDTASIAGERPKQAPATTSATTQTSGPLGPLSADATTQTAAQSTTTVLQVVPTAGEPTSGPAISKLALFFMLAFYVFLMLGNVCERWVWMSANDMTREAVVRAGAGGIGGWIAPALTAVDRWVGVDNAMLG